MKKFFSWVIILLLINTGCNQETKSKNQPLYLLGEWKLDEDSYSTVNRGCISLELDDSIAKFEIIKHKTNYLIRLNNETNTTWQSALSKKNINGSQILNTSDIGGFCGEQTEARLILRLHPESRNKIIGTLEAPICDPCPAINFVAHRVTQTKSIDK